MMLMLGSMRHRRRRHPDRGAPHGSALRARRQPPEAAQAAARSRYAAPGQSPATPPCSPRRSVAGRAIRQRLSTTAEPAHAGERPRRLSVLFQSWTRATTCAEHTQSVQRNRAASWVRRWHRCTLRAEPLRGTAPRSEPGIAPGPIPRAIRMTCIVMHSWLTMRKDIDRRIPTALTGHIRIVHSQAQPYPINHVALAALSERTAGGAGHTMMENLSS